VLVKKHLGAIAVLESVERALILAPDNDQEHAGGRRERLRRLLRPDGRIYAYQSPSTKRRAKAAAARLRAMKAGRRAV
jgi:hypothetical protein